MNTAEVINQLFGEGQDSQQSNQRGFFGPMMFRGPGGRSGTQTDQESGSQAQVVAAADSQTNTVVVTGSPPAGANVSARDGATVTLTETPPETEYRVRLPIIFKNFQP